MHVQTCTSCGKFRFTDQYQTWSHWQDIRLMTEQQGYIAQKVQCQYCDQRRMLRKCNRQAAISNRR